MKRFRQSPHAVFAEIQPKRIKRGLIFTNELSVPVFIVTLRQHSRIESLESEGIVHEQPGPNRWAGGRLVAQAFESRG